MHQQERLSLELTLARQDQCPAAAQEARARLSQNQWQLLVHFAIHVVALAEAHDPERIVVFESVPRDLSPQ
jgi:hypothetical protein